MTGLLSQVKALVSFLTALPAQSSAHWIAVGMGGVSELPIRSLLSVFSSLSSYHGIRILRVTSRVEFSPLFSSSSSQLHCTGHNDAFWAYRHDFMIAFTADTHFIFTFTHSYPVYFMLTTLCVGSFSNMMLCIGNNTCCTISLDVLSQCFYGIYVASVLRTPCF